ncbi:hypothetical protein PROFUN_06257 [Planoprotostelium fungivorum]|uniref:Uncharacterized protein n=1 Tax=Planoprotostelium fungivorum TaxID=1890364 RepID=A0A2P6NE92_9EUKA|nr:hypothetical protein PROFUN_06257 [Planoprotostelium fungivorum]
MGADISQISVLSETNCCGDTPLDLNRYGNETEGSSTTFIHRTKMAQHQRTGLTMAQHGDLLYSLCFQRFETVEFYSRLLQKLHTYAKSFDEGTPAARENVWTRLHSLMGSSKKNNEGKSGGLFTPLLHQWLKESTINLFGLELLYVSFVTSTSANADSNFGDSSNTVFTPWGNTIPASLYRLDLLKHWESKLEKLSVLHKKAIWNICEQMPFFSNYDPKSFKKTLADWYLNPLMNATYITVLFGAIGYLKDTSVLKCDFCYPRSKVPVFPRSDALNSDAMSSGEEEERDEVTSLTQPVEDMHFRRRHAIVMERSTTPQPPKEINHDGGKIVHPYRRNSSVDLHTLVASALATLNHQKQQPPPTTTSSLPEEKTTNMTAPTEVSGKRRGSKEVIDGPPGKRRKSNCSDESKAPIRQRRRSIMAINSLLC